MTEPGTKLSERELRLLGDETQVYAARVEQVSFAGRTIKNALVVLTENRFIASRIRHLHRPAADVDVPWSAFTAMAGESEPGQVTHRVLTFTTSAGPLVVTDEPTFCYQIETHAAQLMGAPPSQ